MTGVHKEVLISFCSGGLIIFFNILYFRVDYFLEKRYYIMCVI